MWFQAIALQDFRFEGFTIFVKCLVVNAMVSSKQCRFVDSKHLKDSSLVKPVLHSSFAKESFYSKTALGGFSRLLCKIFVLKVLPSFVKSLDVNARVSAKQCRFVDSKHLKDSSLVILG